MVLRQVAKDVAKDLMYSRAATTGVGAPAARILEARTSAPRGEGKGLAQRLKAD